MNSFYNIGLEIVRLSNELKRQMDNRLAGYGIDSTTHCQNRIIDFLYDNRERNIFQRDLETELCIRRSAISSILQLMEKNGLISRVPVQSDARLKQIVLTDRALEIHCRTGNEQYQMNQILTEGFSEEELQQFHQYLQRVRNNLKKEEIYD